MSKTDGKLVVSKTDGGLVVSKTGGGLVVSNMDGGNGNIKRQIIRKKRNAMSKTGGGRKISIEPSYNKDSILNNSKIYKLTKL
jgi:hypothetical protein